ncbi:ABC transporter substrate-binding protein [Scytonema sp. UIC 10036]|uniref:ABC transporter substrate-binding protein n=1 Tax=Scytonema sp. UIC 10036 TaxID=2304196 RepID=UPI00140FE152
MERILKLKPDLILMADQFEPAYEQLSKIAPAVLIDIWKDRIPIKANFRYIAEIVGKEKEGEEVLARYQERISKFKNQLGDRLLNSEISVLGYYQNQLFPPANWASYFQVFQDIGLPIKPILLRKEEYSNISIEAVGDFEADIMFFTELNNPSKPLYQNPLIQFLKAVKNNRAYIVDGSIWEFYSPIGINLFLDDLSKYLLEIRYSNHNFRLG